MLHIDEAAVRVALDWDTLIAAMEHALTSFSAGRAIQPVRSMLTVEESRRYFGVMPVVAGDVMGVKCVSFYPGNERSSYPTHMAMILLFDSKTGMPLATLDGRLITEMRTAAVSAALTKRLAAPESAILAILGSGVQAHAHVEALSRVRTFSEIRVWSRTPESAARFAREVGARAMTAEAAVRGADVVVVATSSRVPVLQGAWLKTGAHVNAVGACRPNWRELDDDALASVLVVDSRESAASESGDVMLSGATIYAEAGEIFGGQKLAPTSQTTVFKSLGLAIEDIVTAKLVYDAVRSRVLREH